MLASEVLAKARAHVAGGWHEPLSLDAGGRICTHADEGISRYCLLDALLAASHGDLDAMFAAEAVLVAQLRHAGWDAPMYRWLERNGRTHREVLQLLTKSHAHAVAKESR